jgi:2-polyprenyl-3-methyl-5-hydroxy-6-metoxy-1,4-benzoquinol methylase
MDNSDWIDAPCGWCGSAAQEVVFKGPDLNLHLPGTFQIVRCGRCGLYRQNPYLRWERLKDYYAEEYGPYVSLISREKTRVRRIDRRYGMWKRRRAVEKYQPGGKLLDVGCGTGIFLEEAVRSGRWEVTGVEPTRSAALYARQSLRIPVHEGLFHEIDLPPESFDVITFWNVLEHTVDPIRSLEYAHHLLKKDGWLVLSLPNLESLGKRIFASHWLGWDLPRHLYLFPRPILITILRQIGFDLVSSRCIAGSYSTLKRSMELWSEEKNCRNQRMRRLLLRLFDLPVTRLALSPTLWLEDRLKLSCVITFFARKTFSGAIPSPSILTPDV